MKKKTKKAIVQALRCMYVSFNVNEPCYTYMYILDDTDVFWRAILTGRVPTN